MLEMENARPPSRPCCHTTDIEGEKTIERTFMGLSHVEASTQVSDWALLSYALIVNMACLIAETSALIPGIKRRSGVADLAHRHRIAIVFRELC